MRQLSKGNVAVVKAAILAGCRAYYGYPITPASEIAEAAALISIAHPKFREELYQFCEKTRWLQRPLAAELAPTK